MQNICEEKTRPPTEGRQKFNQNLNHISKRWDLPLRRRGSGPADL